jgi:predicted cupin superfamily sugar epimerase
MTNYQAKSCQIWGMDRVNEWVQLLNLNPHPEGGYYAETYRSSLMTDTPAGPRPVATSIFFLLMAGNFSAFHRIVSDEGWHHYEGDPVFIHTISPEGKYQCIRLGKEITAGERPQALVPGGYWFASECKGPLGYALVGCTVAPGFDFNDFELADRDDLLRRYPAQSILIERLTR